VPNEARLDGRYQLDERIAAGGYGEVWRATDLVLGRPVAVKLLLAQHVQAAETLARFRAEAQRAGALTQGNIARIYDYVEPKPPQPPFLVMELIEGPSLAQVLADGPLPPAQVMDILAGAAAGLQAAHDAGLVHRDIKPANLMLAKDGTVKVTDFGISYAAGSAPMTASGMLVGTAGYMAPERLGGGPVTGSADLYALGIVGYEALAGHPPFTGSPLEIAIKHRDQPLPPLPPSVPPGVAALIGALIAKDPADRPASAGEVARWASHEHDMLVSQTRTDLPAGATPPIGLAAPGMTGPGPGTGRRTAPTMAAYGQTPPTQQAYGAGAYGAGTGGGYPPQGTGGGYPPEPYAPPEEPPRRSRKGLVIAALAAVVLIAAVAIGLVLSNSGGTGTPKTVQSTTTPSVASSTPASPTTHASTAPTTANSAPAGGGGHSVAPTHRPTTAPPTTTPPTTTAPTTTAPTPTTSAAATTAPTAASTVGAGGAGGGGNGNGTSQGGGTGGQNGG